MKKLGFIVCGLVLAYGGYAQSANDAGITGIIAPAATVPANSSQPVSVTVKNFGTSPLTAATLGFSVNGAVQPTSAWTGNLAANATSAAVNLGNFTFPAGTHILKAWSKLPNAAVDGNPTNDTIQVSITTCASLSGNYTINKSAVASSTIFTSFATAAQALANCGISGPVVFNIAPNSGPYNEAINFTNIWGASATNTITINGNGNTVIGNTTTSADAVVKLDGSKYFRFNNLKVETVPTAPLGAGVILQNNANYNSFNGCTISHSISSTTPVNCLNVNTGSSSNIFQNNTINGGFFGVSHFGTTAAPLTNNQFIGNTLKDQNATAISCGYSTNTLFEGNDISRPACTTCTNLTVFNLTTGNVGAIISKNRIHNTHDAAITTAGSTVYGVTVTAAGTAANVNIIKNNLMYNINNTGGTFYAFNNSNGHYTSYFHNTVSADNPAITYATLRGIHFQTASNNVKFINNILSLSSPATTKHAIYLNNTGISLVSNNNDLYVGTTGNIGFYTADIPTFTAWQAAKTNAYDQNSVSVDPVFVNPANNLLPYSSVVNNAGQGVPTITDDINGTIVRSTTTPDPGAYEFTPAGIDAGVTAITAPTSPVTPGPNQPVQVTLKNFGTTTLTAATIGWSVNGAAQADYTWSGSLTNLQSSASLQIGTHTFPAGNFTIKVWSKLPNATADPFAVNDTTILKVVSCVPLAGAYTINKNNPTAGTNFQSIAEATQRLNSCGVAGAVTFTVVSGTGPYNEQVEILNIPFVNATNTVIFEGNGNTVTPPTATTTTGAKPGIFILNGARYVKLNNFVVTLDQAATTGWGVQLIHAADFNTISNNTINLPLASTSTSINGIITGAIPGETGNHASNTRITNNTINGGSTAIQISGNTGGLNADNNQIVNNQLKDPNYSGIIVNNANGTLIERNDISRPARTNGVTLYNIQLTGASMNTIVSKNRLHNANDMSTTTTGYLYGIFTSAQATAGNENIIRNNAVYNLNNAGGSVYAFYHSGANGTYYYNNTVASDPAISYNILEGLYFGSTAAANVKFINNIISLPGTATTKYAMYLGNTPPIAMISSNNDLYIGTTGNIGYYLTAQVTLANWKAVNSNAFDQNSVSIDPAFVSPATGNLKPTASTIDNLGQPLAAVTDDILGAVRTATPDFGAFEFGVAANDVGIVAISGPGTTGCGLSATETITVTIRNFGANQQPSVPVSLWVDAVLLTPTGETYSAAPLAPTSTATYTFIAKANLLTSGAHQIIAKTQLSSDFATSNDADTLNITNSLITTALPISFDFETTASGVSRFSKVTNPKSNITEGAGASNGTGSTKGLIMDGVANTNWNPPAGLTDPWTSNPDNFSAAYICLSPAGGAASDSLWLTFDLKQLFKTAAPNTNFRVTVNGTQVGPTYRPPFSGTGGTTNWTKVKTDLIAYKNDPFVRIGLESSVGEEYANGTGTANLIDNISILRRLVVSSPTGVKENTFASQLHVFPNPSKGNFFVSLENGTDYTLKVTDLTGKIILSQKAKGDAKLNLEGAAKGIYLLNVTSENGSTVRKLIVE
jgi:hypothetical protein